MQESCSSARFILGHSFKTLNSIVPQPPFTPAPPVLLPRTQALVWMDGDPAFHEPLLSFVRSKSDLQRSLAELLAVRARLKAKVRGPRVPLPVVCRT